MCRGSLAGEAIITIWLAQFQSPLLTPAWPRGFERLAVFDTFCEVFSQMANKLRAVDAAMCWG